MYTQEERKDRNESKRIKAGTRQKKHRKIRDLCRCNLELELLGLLPRVVLVTEVTVRGGSEVDGLLEVELLDCGVLAGKFLMGLW